MSRLASQSQSQCQSLVLASYPFCEGCLSWSEDALAVGCTSHLYIITQDRGTKDGEHNVRGRLHINDVRASLFNTSEWPPQDLATITHLSLIEEQSDSVVLAIEWSPAGVGIHRRSVLAVLTSNLLLSLWETDGAHQNWRRTLVVNQRLQDWDSKNAAVNELRRRIRIRAFSWTQPLHLVSTTKWGRQCLIFVDDEGTIYVTEISKDDQHEFGGWSLTTLTTCDLAVHNTGLAEGGYVSNLQSTIAQHAPINRLVTSAWLDDHDELAATDASTALAYIQAWHAYSSKPRLTRVSVTIANLTLSAIAEGLSTQEDSSTIDRSVNVLIGPPVVYSFRDVHGWTEELRGPVETYDRQNQLAGNYRIRVWGQADCPYSGKQALCVSLHPLDMYEYTSPVLEKCRLFIRTSPQSVMPQELPFRCLEGSDVSVKVHAFLIDQVQHSQNQLDALDARLLRVWCAYSDLRGLPHTDHHALRETRKLTPPGSDLYEAQTRSNADKNCEVCEICESSIAMTLDRESARCSLGHLFSRCALSMLAIQEPGISKYCSNCNRQFLHLPKLGPLKSPSLMHALYDEFDVCPYCSGKYRG